MKRDNFTDYDQNIDRRLRFVEIGVLAILVVHIITLLMFLIGGC